ncbi:MAG TPA: NUDIX hydrolase [Trebonia sp.]|nr:NUDIX hydrolase [Trebonia sp.]
MSKRLRLNWSDGRLAERAAAISEGRVAPAPPRDAATVVVARAVGRGAEILMLKRPGSMVFAAGAYVFPGGSVDAADADPGIRWRGPAPAQFGARLGAAPELARALVVAAVRETFEESGVLLAGSPDGGPAGGPVAVAGPGWERDRAALNSGELSFPALLARRDLAVLADRLVPWARWITPEAEPKRFDARFFAALMPPGQAIAAHEAEADNLAWIAPEAALASARAGEIMLLPPTAVILGEFACMDDLATTLAAHRAITPVQPRIVAGNDRAWLEIPDEVVYPL